MNFLTFRKFTSQKEVLTNKLLLLGLLILFNCKDEEKNPLIDKVVGRYEGFINYSSSTPIPGDDPVEYVHFDVTQEGINQIKIATTFNLVLPVTGIFTNDANGDEIITLGGGGKERTYTSNEIEITCGETNFSIGDGGMCGYYNVTRKEFRIAFGWSNANEGGGGIIIATKQD